MKKIRNFCLLLLLPLCFAACPADERESNSNTVNFISLEANGDDITVTTVLTLAFDKDIIGLTAADIAFDGGSTGASKGPLNKTGIGAFRLGISGITSNGNVSVTVTKSGYDITNGTRSVFAYYPKNWDVTFVANGGTPAPGDQAVTHNAAASRPVNPVKQGQLFFAWYTDAAFTDQWNFSTDTVTSDVTLYARYVGQDQLPSAQDYFNEKNLAVGWNIGNSLDAGGWSSDGPNETAWGNPVINQAIMNGVKEAGFNLIRIPVTWRRAIGPAPDYAIDARMLRRVAEVVGYAEKAGLTAIINLHHDGQVPPSSGETSWLLMRQARESQEEYDRITDQFSKVWTQIAEHFKDYGLSLIFESFNELHDGNWGWFNEQQAIDRNEALQFEIINSWNQVFTDVVRDSGGINSFRYLIVSGLCQRPHQTIKDSFIMPDDPVPGRQILSIHYYDPESFSLRGSSATWKDLTVPVPEQIPAEEGIAFTFAEFKEKFVNRNIPVIIGEAGPILARSSATIWPGGTVVEIDTELAHQNRLSYIAYMYGTAKANGIVPVYWDNGKFDRGGDGFGLFDRNTGLPGSDESDACIKAMIDAVK